MAKTYYKRAVLLSFWIALGCNILYMILESLFSTYKSEWLTMESFFPIMLFMVLVNALIFAVLCLTILLNHYMQINSGLALSALTWFAFPAAWIAFLFIATAPDTFDYSHGWDSAGIFLVLNTVPYVIVLIMSYVKFRRALKSQI